MSPKLFECLAKLSEGKKPTERVDELESDVTSSFLHEGKLKLIRSEI